MLTNVFYHFKKSALRNEKLKKIEEVLNEPQLKYKEIHQVRWMAFYKALETLYLTWDSLVTYFEQEIESKQDKDGKMKGYVKKLTQYEFVATIYMMMDILPIIMELTLIFQKKDSDCSVVHPAISSCLAEIQKYKDGTVSPTKPTFFKEFEKELKFSNDSTTCHLKTHKISANHQSREHFAKVRQEFLENLIGNLNKRFPEEAQNIISACSVLAMKNLSFIPSKDIHSWRNDKLEILISHFDHNESSDEKFIDPDSTRHEWSAVKSLVIQEKYPCDNMGTLWNIIHKFHKDTFPNMLKLAAFALTLPVHTADCERGFSLQNNIKNSQGNRLLSDRLDTLMVISAEGPAKEEFKFDQALLKWSQEKHRKIFSKAKVKA